MVEAKAQARKVVAEKHALLTPGQGGWTTGVEPRVHLSTHQSR